ncbi:hypothetical protein GOP47_0019373 [Adiantum capillus-veneris]|uniref:Uncharacterized protein n=1 Tax=Adiantum capillus-veneris TaxID=13818 RepID=A0A9D4UAX2_ADICA|nr:hypothetical protein GOP47_0019373 [Adiantum capillus-veneris]
MKTPTSLSCNHHFCMACILQLTSEEYTITFGTCCPKCNLPATRHQAIYSPEFDKLVSIYQGLELDLACLRPCCRETYKNFKEEGNAIKKVKKKRRRKGDAVFSVHQRAEGVVEGEKEAAVVSLHQRPENVVERNEGAALVSLKGPALVSLNQRSECVVEREEESTVFSLNRMLPCVGEEEKEATVAPYPKKKVKKKGRRESDAVVSVHQRAEGVKEAAVISILQMPENVVEGKEGAALVSPNQRSECIAEREEEASVLSLNLMLPCVGEEETEATVASYPIKKVKKNCRRKSDAVVSVHQRAEVVVEGVKEAAVVSIHQRPENGAEGKEGAALVSPNQRSECVAEREEEAAVLSLNLMLPCVGKEETEATAASYPIKKVKKKRRRESDAVVSVHQRAEGVKEAAVVSIHQRPENVVEGKEGAALVSPNQRSECVTERKAEAAVLSLNPMLPCVGEEKEAIVASYPIKKVKKKRRRKRDPVVPLHQRSEGVLKGDKEAAVISLNQSGVVEGNKEAALASLNQRSECIVEVDKQAAAVFLVQRLLYVGEEKEASVASLNQGLSCVVEKQKEAAVFVNQISPHAAEGGLEAAAGSLNQRSACPVGGHREAASISSTQRSPCVVEEDKKASDHSVEVQNICAPKKNKKRKRLVSYKGHPTMSKRVQLPCPIFKDLEEQEENASLVHKTCPSQSEALQEISNMNKESLPIVSDSNPHLINDPETAVVKTVTDCFCLPCEDAKGNLVIGNVIGIMSKEDHTVSSPTSNHETSAGCNNKQKILALDELSCVFCQAPDNSLVAGPMMHYARGLPVQAGRRIKSLVSVHQLCAEWAPNVYYVGNAVKNLGKEVARGQKLKCSQCGLKGAVLGCLIKCCIKSYHYPCARSLSCRWDPDNFVVLCPDHVAECLPCDEPTVKPIKLKNKLKAASGKLPQSDQLGQIKVYKGHSSENQRECKAEKPAAEPSCMNTARISFVKWTSVVGRELVLCGSGLNSAAHALLASFAMQTGARLTEPWDSRVTHLIIATDGEGAAARTFKFMSATLAGRWILKLNWVEACMSACQLVREEPYEVNLDIHKRVGGPRRARLIVASTTRKLLENIEFYFLGDYAAAYKMDLQALVSAAGGRIEDDCWNAQAMQTCTRIVVYNAGITPDAESLGVIRSRWSQAKSVAHKAQAYVVAHTWILDSIAAYELQPFHH